MVDRRVLARVIDEAVIGFLMSPLLFFAALIAGLSHIAADRDQAGATSRMVVIVVVFAAVLYEVLTTRAGGGLGKKLCGLRVVDSTSGGGLSWRQSVLRGLLVSVQLEFWLWLSLGGSESLPGRVQFWGVAALCLAWRFALVISIERDGTDGVHDRLVHSCVVRAESAVNR